MCDRTYEFLRNVEFRMWYRSWFKPVATIEEADFVIKENTKRIKSSVICKNENSIRTFNTLYIEDKLIHYVSLNIKNKEKVVQNFNAIKLGDLTKRKVFYF